MKNEDSEIIRNSIRKIAETEIPKYLTSDNYNTVPRSLFKKLCTHGLGTPTISETYGGSELNPLATAIIFEELARVDLGVAIFMSVHSMVAGLIQSFADDQIKSNLLPKLNSGEILAAFALTEPQAGSDAGNLKTSAKEEQGFYILNGEKCYITSAGFADLYLIFATSNPALKKNGISAFLLPANANGLTVSPPERKMGAELSPIASLSLNNVKISKTDMLGDVDDGYKVALSGLAGGRINIAACALGISTAAIDKARSHLLERQQFGQRLADFQGLQFMLADMYMKLEAARQLTIKAAQELGNKNSSVKNTALCASVAKCYATDAAMAITTDAVQLLGGAGYIYEYGVEKLMRAAKMLQIVEGTNQIQRNIIARKLLS